MKTRLIPITHIDRDFRFGPGMGTVYTRAAPEDAAFSR